MRKALAISLSLTLCALLARTAAAQEVPMREAGRAQLLPDARSKVIFSDTLADFQTRRVPGGRVDVEAGIFRARYRLSDRVRSGLTAREAAFEHVSRSARSYGVTEPSENLTVESIIEGRYSTHVRLRQTLEGIPVHGRQMKVSLDKHGQPTMVINGYAPHLEDADNFDPVPRISASRALRIVRTAAARGLDSTEPELVVYPSKPPRLAWKMTAVMADLPVEYEVLVDARSGEIIQMLDVTLHANGTIDLTEPERNGPPTEGSAKPSAYSRSEAVEFVDGTGWVFDPDPLSSAGVEYGGEFVDNNDADSPALTNQLFTVTLPDITLGNDGLYRLTGPYVTIDGTSTGYQPPAESAPGAFTYTRSNDYFEAVMAYYHVDKSQRHVQSLDIGFPIKDVPVRVNPQGRTDDESNFSNSENLIRFGTGAIDDGEDADVIWHEYAHALLFFTAPDIPLGATEGGAFHEGWSDYWAASYSRYLSEEDGQIPSHDWRKVFNWDGNSGCWQGRRLDHPGHYPDDTHYSTEDCIGDKYQEGMLWATTLMDIYPHVGRTVLDRLNLASHAYLGTPFTFTDAAEALIQADLDLYEGAHSNILVHYLSERGYVDESNYGPVISHDPLTATEQTAGTIRIEATAAATTASIDSVLVFYGTGGSATNRLVLQPQGGDLYAGDLPLPGGQATMSYYVQAVDVEGRRRSLPAAAPIETYSFDVGPDTHAPVIAHNPMEQISVVGWPISVFASVQDNLGVDSVWVQYAIESPRGGTTEEGYFSLGYNGESYFGEFPAAPVESGGAVTYRIFANDVATEGNLGVLPEEGSFRVPFVEEGIVRFYDFEGIGQGLQRSGAWMRGAPSYGLRVAHSGSTVWATAPAGTYPDAPQVSSLALPALDLSGLSVAYLIFWHWYDAEHTGVTEPSSYDPEAGIWDGGNVKVSTDGGTSWQIVEPQDGYSGVISEGYDNPMGGEDAFGGYSFGWRREIIPLPPAEDVRIRFDFGTDLGNQQESKFYAGWYLDDVTVTATLPQDDAAPQVLALPAPRAVRIPEGEDPPIVTVEAVDDTGIAAVISEYVLLQGNAVLEGTTRLAMAETDTRVFAGAAVPHGSFSPGDHIEYYIVVRDFDGNEVRFGNPFVIDYRTQQQTQALRSAVATGAWSAQGSGWAAGHASSETVSSLVLEPFTLPSNGEQTEFLLEHSYTFGDGVGGNVKVSRDDGKRWEVLVPAEGYPETLEGTHPMGGEGIFADTVASEISSFDLSAYAGSEIRIRLDMAQTRTLESGESWTVSAASYRTLSPDPEIVTELVLMLHANFPDPIVSSTTISYTIPERMPVRLSVYDILGRRVDVIRHANHDPGTYTITYEPRDLASGVYYLYMETTAGTRVEEIVVSK